MTNTSVLEREDVELHTGQKDDECAHYIRKELVGELFGAVEALCGYVWVPMRSPKGLPVCQRCKTIWESLPPPPGGSA